jgi:hypothetical protein
MQRSAFSPMFLKIHRQILEHPVVTHEEEGQSAAADQ